MEELINISFLSTEMKEKYLQLLSERYNRLVGWNIKWIGDNYMKTMTCK